MSNIEINTGGGTTISGITTTTSSVAVKQPSINVSVGGVIGGGSDAHFVFAQEQNSDEWEVEHNLNKYPSVTIVDSGNNIVYAEVEYTNLNNLIIRFNSGNSGKAYLN